MSRRTWPGMMLFFVVLASAVWAADVTWDSEFENTLYNTPKGWSTTQQAGARMLIPPDLKRGEQAAIVITPGARLTGDFKEGFNQLRAELRGDAKANESAMQSATADEGYAVLYVAEQIQDANGKPKQFRYCFASNPQKSLELVMLVANSEEAYKRYSPAFESFLTSLSYKSARPGAHASSGPSTAPAR